MKAQTKDGAGHIQELILICEECGERKFLNVSEATWGHRWEDACNIADTFDDLHNLCEETV